ncbi:MAG: hypothetical protein ABI353_02590, partial [Isosphaeraceae bacterium]
MARSPEKDLAVLVADKNMEFAIKGIVSRTEALNIRQVRVDVYVHPERDPGCLGHGHNFLENLVNEYKYYIVMFDREGCGRDALSRS